MRILFAGPSLAPDMPEIAERHAGIRFAGPVRRGDVLRAVAHGATAIGIVDGLFREVPPVWHKEILHALSLGVAVAGGGSMGALRAAECAAFGMVGIGTVYRRYIDGLSVDDADVAQEHAPGALGWTGLTEALVTIDASVDGARAAAVITPDEADALYRAARLVHYADRTFAAVVAVARVDPGRRGALLTALSTHRADVKRQDAHGVVAWLAAQPDRRGPPPADWTFAETGAFRAFAAEERSP
jgi:hypothetical protein